MMFTDDETLQKIQVLKRWDKEHNFGLFRKLIGDECLPLGNYVWNEKYGYIEYYILETVMAGYIKTADMNICLPCHRWGK